MKYILYDFARWVSNLTTIFTTYEYAKEGGNHYLIENTLGQDTFAWCGDSFQMLYEGVPQPYRKYLKEAIEANGAELGQFIAEDDCNGAYQRLLSSAPDTLAWEVVTPWYPIEDEVWTVEDLLEIVS